MKKLTDYELKNIRGGFTVWTFLGISALGVFLSGIIDGFVHPKSCGGDTQ